MYCENCGKECENTTLCSECKKQTAKRRKPSGKIIAVLCGVIVIAVSCIALFNKSDAQESSSIRAGEFSLEGFADYIKSSATKSSGKSYSPLTSKKDQTILIYIVGSDLESENMAASLDLCELMNSDIDTDKTSVVVYTGGANYWHNGIPADKNCVLYLQNPGELGYVSQNNAMNMGDPFTLANFLEYGYSAFPADEYSLILWNHGGGTINGYGVDQISGDVLFLKELNSALENSPFNEKNKLKWVAFDACLMATVETAFVFSDYAEYMIACQEISSAMGFDYTELNKVCGKGMSAKAVAQSISTSAQECLYSSNNDALSFMADKSTYSCIDLSKVDEVETALGALFKKVDNNLADDYDDLCRIINSLYNYASSFNQSTYTDLVDLGGLVRGLKAVYPDEAQNLLNVLNNFVVYNNTKTSYSNGVSIYIPFNDLSYIDTYLMIYETIGFSDVYTDFISDFVKALSSDGEDIWSDSEEIEETAAPTTAAPTTAAPTTDAPTTDAPTTAAQESTTALSPNEKKENIPVSNITLNLNEKQRKHLLEAEKNVYCKNDQGLYWLVSRTSDVTVSQNSLSADFDNYYYELTDGKTRSAVSLIEVSRTEDEVMYIAPAILSKADSRDYFSFLSEGFTVKVAIVFNDKYPEGKVLGFYFFDDSENSRLYQFEKGCNLLALAQGADEKEYDEYGNLKPITSWKQLHFLHAEEYLVTDSELKLVKTKITPDEKMYGNIVITDTYGYSFGTSFRRIKYAE